MKNIHSVLTLFVFIIFCGNTIAQKNSGTLQKVIIIRHGEKPQNGDNLSCQGFNRSVELPAVLYAKFKTPDYIFTAAPKEGKSTNAARMFETIIPYAVKYNLNIDTRFFVEDTKGVATAIMKKSGTVLVVWEHNHIIEIVKALGIVDANLKWKDSDFDSIWIITFQNGKATLTTDKENLQPSDVCK